MENETTFVFTPDSQTMLMIWLLLALLAVAVGIELYRRHRQRRQVLETEWRTLREVAKEKELGEEEARLLEAIVARHAPDRPLRAVTVRQEFDVCVTRELEAIERRGQGRLLEAQGALLHDIRVRLGLDYIPFGRRIHTTRELYHAQVVWMATDLAAEAGHWTRMSVSSVDEAHFYLRVEGGEPPSVEVGQEAHFRMWREEDGRYLFRSRLVRIESVPALYMFRHARSLERTQARAHFRVRYDHTGNVAIMNAPVDGELSGHERRPPITRVRGRFVSLSGGGLAVVLPQPIPKQVLLRASLDLEPGSEPVEVTARPIVVQPMSGGEYLVRCAFVEMEDDIRDRIIHYAFEKQKHLQVGEEGAAGGLG